MRKLLYFILFLIVAFVGYLLFNALTWESTQKQVGQSIVEVSLSDSTSVHLSRAIQIATISPEDPIDFDSSAFFSFKNFIQKTYPLADSLLSKEVVNSFSLIFEWEGSDPALSPIVLASHLDVVPASEENVDLWKFPPFSGHIDGKTIWGRGAIDDKIGVIGIMEAVEHLLQQGYNPKRTVILAFGHDEENSGQLGAKSIVQILKKRNVKPIFVLDEGYAVTQNMIPGITKEVAFIGIAEKGFLTLELSVNIEGGHASMPKEEGTIDILAEALYTLHENKLPPQITPPVQKFIEAIGPEMAFKEKLAMANLFVFEPLIIKIYEKTPSGNALVSTTMAPTIIRAGFKENVIPAQGVATINFRLLPGQSVQSVIDHVTTTVADQRISIKTTGFVSEPSMVSSTESLGYLTLETTIRELFPEALIAPNLVLGATDGRYYQELCDDVYRFVPYPINPENVSAFHGINERIDIKDFHKAIRFYIRLIKNSGV